MKPKVLTKVGQLRRHIMAVIHEVRGRIGKSPIGADLSEEEAPKIQEALSNDEVVELLREEGFHCRLTSLSGRQYLIISNSRYRTDKENFVPITPARIRHSASRLERNTSLTPAVRETVAA